MIWLFQLFRIDREPTSFELFLFKWIFMPFLVFSVIVIFISSSVGRNKCESACITEGYADYMYAPSRNYGLVPESCVCFTEEEASRPLGMKEGADIWE
jgi:hypothetical protein